MSLSQLTRLQIVVCVTVFLLYAYILYEFYRKTKSLSTTCEERITTAITLRQDLADCRSELEDITIKEDKKSNKEIEYYTKLELKIELNRMRVGCYGAKLYQKYTNYTPRALCPDDWNVAQALLQDERCSALGLPRRNCFAVSPPLYNERGLNSSSKNYFGKLWDDKVSWTHYGCKSYACLNKRTKGYCRQCFDMKFEEKRWNQIEDNTSNSEKRMTLSSVVSILKGRVRIGLDIGGGTGTFAAQLAERYDAIIATIMLNKGAPYLETISQRGLVGLELGLGSRLPFFDNTLDIIHSMNAVQFLLPEMLRLVLLDWDRVLRPGGIIWLEYFALPEASMPPYIELFKSIKYIEHQWFKELYFGDLHGKPERISRISLVLEKPNRSAFKFRKNP